MDIFLSPTMQALLALLMILTIAYAMKPWTIAYFGEAFNQVALLSLDLKKGDELEIESQTSLGYRIQKKKVLIVKLDHVTINYEIEHMGQLHQIEGTTKLGLCKIQAIAPAHVKVWTLKKRFKAHKYHGIGYLAKQFGIGLVVGALLLFAYASLFLIYAGMWAIVTYR